MATPVFAPGYVCKANFTISGGAAADVNIIGWDWLESVIDLITLHSGSGGVTERIPGPLDGRGAVQFNYDIANQFHKTPLLIIPGAKGMFKLYVSATLFLGVPVMIQEVPWKVAVAGKVEIAVNILMSGDAGTYVRPL